ncbi:MAG: alpha/beta fold hydrolase [Luteibacter sp.]
MFRREFLKTTVATAVLAAVFPAHAKTAVVAKTLAPSSGNVADVNGQHLFYGVHGTGKPLVLLHGGIDPDSFGPNVAELAKHRQVIAVHLQAHGRTPDTDRPLRAETMGDDIAALVGYLKLGKADVMGYSLGAGVALQAAIRHPDAVDRLVLVSVPMRQDGFYPEGVEAFRQLEANASTLGPAVKASPLGKTYPNVDWTRLFSKVGDMTKRPFDVSADVARLKARTMLVYADADATRPEHMVEFWKALGGGRRDAGIDGSLRPGNALAILPDTTHYTLATAPLLPEIVQGFLA